MDESHQEFIAHSIEIISVLSVLEGALISQHHETSNDIRALIGRTRLLREAESHRLQLHISSLLDDASQEVSNYVDELVQDIGSIVPPI